MSRLNPFQVKITSNGIYERLITIEPAVNHDHNWKWRGFRWKTKKSVIKNLTRIYGKAEQI